MDKLDYIEGMKDKVYVGNVEAFEIAQERNIDKLPRKGKEILTVRCKPLTTLIIGKDEHGFYIGELC